MSASGYLAETSAFGECPLCARSSRTKIVADLRTFLDRAPPCAQHASCEIILAIDFEFQANAVSLHFSLVQKLNSVNFFQSEFDFFQTISVASDPTGLARPLQLKSEFAATHPHLAPVSLAQGSTTLGQHEFAPKKPSRFCRIKRQVEHRLWPAATYQAILDGPQPGKLELPSLF